MWWWWTCARSPRWAPMWTCPSITTSRVSAGALLPIVDCTKLQAIEWFGTIRRDSKGFEEIRFWMIQNNQWALNSIASNESKTTPMSASIRQHLIVNKGQHDLCWHSEIISPKASRQRHSLKAGQMNRLSEVLIVLIDPIDALRRVLRRPFLSGPWGHFVKAGGIVKAFWRLFEGFVKALWKLSKSQESSKSLPSALWMEEYRMKSNRSDPNIGDSVRRALRSRSDDKWNRRCSTFHWVLLSPFNGLVIADILTRPGCEQSIYRFIQSNYPIKLSNQIIT